jgi:hypothetical protein
MDEDTYRDYSLSLERATHLANEAQDETIGGIVAKAQVFATLAQFWLAYADHISKVA